MTSSARLRIGYISIEDPNDRDAWSGTTYAMMQSLRDAGAVVDPIVVSMKPLEILSKLHGAFSRIVSSGKHMRNRETWYLKALGARASHIARSKSYDAFVSPSTLPVTYASLDAPLFVWTDATLASMIDFYPSFTGLGHRTVSQGSAAERYCLKKCSTAVFSSKWAARGASTAYGAANVADVPFGGNLAPPETTPDFASKAATWSKAPRFLVVGKDWHVKGGDRAVALIEELRRRGYPATLRVVGVQVDNPPSGEWFSSSGFVSKNAAGGEGSLAREYADAHVLLILSRADCTPMVIAEAASFGVPAIGSDVGGIPEQIQHSQSGLVALRPDDPSDIADVIEPYMRSRELFVDLCNGALLESASRLNWHTAGQRMLKLIADRLG